MLEARVQIDTKSLEQDLDDVQRKQLPFATSCNQQDGAARQGRGRGGSKAGV